jgi:hypothetical protein
MNVLFLHCAIPSISIQNRLAQRCANRTNFFYITYVLSESRFAVRFSSGLKETGGHGCTERFIRAIELFISAVAKNLDDRAKGHMYNLESFLTLRRDLVGTKPCFALIEFAARIDLPDEVMSHPVVMALENATLDHVVWSNVILFCRLTLGCR